MAQATPAETKTEGSQPPAEIELLARARAGEEAAVRMIIKTNNRRLYRLARAILREDAEAEDVVQETYVKLFTRLDAFRGEASLTSWLSRIAINDALDRLRKRKATVSWPEAADATAQIIPFPRPAEPGDPEKTMAQREIQRVVERAIDELPDAFRIVFIARVMEEMSAEAVAELLALNVATVKTRLHRARKLLRDSVERQIGPVTLDAFPFAGARCERLTEAVMRRLGF